MLPPSRACYVDDLVAQLADAVDAPLIANMTEYGKSPLLPVDELEAAGFAGVLYPVTALRLAMKAIETGLSLLARDGIQTELIDLEVMQTREELYELLDYNDFVIAGALDKFDVKDKEAKPCK